MITRFLPFTIFRNDKSTPAFILKLGKFLPPAILGMLVIYCYRDFSNTLISMKSFAAILSGFITAFIHYKRRNMLLSIAIGTISYMSLLNFFNF